jgi:hypothetical protein
MIENMIGKKYGRLTVLSQYYKEFAPQKHLFKEYGIEE